MVDEVKVNYETIQESCTKKYFSSWCSFFGCIYIYIFGGFMTRGLVKGIGLNIKSGLKETNGLDSDS